MSSFEEMETVENALIQIGRQRAALDADEAGWLREAERVEVWNKRGLPNAIAYLEQVLGYAPRTAKEKLRVARALEALPALTAALAASTLHYSAVRELTRVATPATANMRFIPFRPLRRLSLSAAPWRKRAAAARRVHAPTGARCDAGVSLSRRRPRRSCPRPDRRRDHSGPCRCS